MNAAMTTVVTSDQAALAELAVQDGAAQRDQGVHYVAEDRLLLRTGTRLRVFAAVGAGRYTVVRRSGAGAGAANQW